MQQRWALYSGLVSLAIVFFAWIFFGYSSLYLIGVLIAAVCFQIYDQTIIHWKVWKKLTLGHLLLIVFSFLLSVAFILAIFMVGKYVLDDLMHVTGWLRSSLVIFLILITLYPVKFTFWSVVENVMKKANN